MHAYLISVRCGQGRLIKLIWTELTKTPGLSQGEDHDVRRVLFTMILISARCVYIQRVCRPCSTPGASQVLTFSWPCSPGPRLVCLFCWLCCPYALPALIAGLLIVRVLLLPLMILTMPSNVRPLTLSLSPYLRERLLKLSSLMVRPSIWVGVSMYPYYHNLLSHDPCSRRCGFRQQDVGRTVVRDQVRSIVELLQLPRSYNALLEEMTSLVSTYVVSRNKFTLKNVKSTATVIHLTVEGHFIGQVIRF